MECGSGLSSCGPSAARNEPSVKLLEALIQHCLNKRITQSLILRCPSVTDTELEVVFRAFRDAGIASTWQDHFRHTTNRNFKAHSVHGYSSALSGPRGKNDRLDVELLGPRLLSRDSLRYGDPRYVNELTIKPRDHQTVPAEVLPPQLKRFWKEPFPPFLNFRVADTGLCLFANRAEEDESIPLPDATTVVRDYLESRSLNLSPDGLAFQQLLVLTDGAVSSFDHPKMRKLLQLFDAGTSDSVPASTSRAITWPDIRRVIPEHPEYSLRLLLRARLIEVGMLLQCDNCGGRGSCFLGHLLNDAVQTLPVGFSSSTRQSEENERVGIDCYRPSMIKSRCEVC